MEVFEGYSIARGSALASVACVRTNKGTATLSRERLQILSRRLQQDPEDYLENEQVILATPDLPTSILVGMIPGLDIAGIAVAGEVEDDQLALIHACAPAIPIVAGLGDTFLAQVSEFEIAILDGDNGRVYVAPDADVVARFQSPGRRRRIFMEGAHLAARTASDNRVISVQARVPSPGALQTAILHGADGIYISSGSRLLSDDGLASTDRQVALFDEMIDTVGGKPLLLDMPAESVALSALLQASAVAPISVAMSRAGEGEEFLASLEVTRVFMTADLRARNPGLQLAAAAGASLPENLDIFDGVLFRQPLHALPTDEVLSWIALASRNGKTVTAVLGEQWEAEIEDVLAFGVDTVIVDPDSVEDVKDAIRLL
ncbi:MAG: hypothetical protein ACLQVD_15100 [Capsulimonadaceae bacterium]